MSVRRLSLEEWFLYHQLQHINRSHFHCDGIVEADLSGLKSAWGERSLPMTAILVKALGLTLKHCPEANRQFARTPFGPRMLIGSNCAINVPVMLNFDGRDYLSVTTIRDADRKSVHEIQAEIRAYRQTPKAALPIGRHLIGKPNTFFNRTRLRLMHALVNSLPGLQLRFGAGMASVSSLLNLDHQGTLVTIMGRGPGGISVTASHFDAASARIRLSVAFDHYVGSGALGTTAMITLTRILQGEIEPAALGPAQTAASGEFTHS